MNFYPRSPRGERPQAVLLPLLEGVISIHAPREGSDPVSYGLLKTLSHFYPRSPRGERHHRPAESPRRRDISIHAPREGSDSLSDVTETLQSFLFLSTLPARGATAWLMS